MLQKYIQKRTLYPLMNIFRFPFLIVFNELEEIFFMNRKRLKINNLINILFFFAGLSIGIFLIWPGIFKSENRRCFYKIIEDGSDGKVSVGTILSIDPNSLIKINNAKNSYGKILRIGDYCFRK